MQFIGQMISDFKKRVKTSNESYLEKIISYMLFYLSLISIGTQLKYLVGRGNRETKKKIVDVYVIIKFTFSLLTAAFGWYSWQDGTRNFLFWILVWFTTETIIYNLLHILSHNLFDQSNSFKRNIILSFFNYLEIVINFSVFYASFDLVRESCNVNGSVHFNWIDYLYFSIGTGGILGYGDYAVFSNTGKLLVMLECIIFIMFFSLFISYNISLFTATKTVDKSTGSG